MWRYSSEKASFHWTSGGGSESLDLCAVQLH